MKKFLLSLFACACTANVFAQMAEQPIISPDDLTDDGSINYEPSTIPQIYAYNGVVNFVSITGERDKKDHYPELTCTVINDDIQSVREFKIKLNSNQHLEHAIVYVKGSCFASDDYFYFTQTLFNNDEKLEYIVANQTERTISIMNEDGKILHTIKAADYGEEGLTFEGYMRINNKDYLVFRENTGDKDSDDFLYFRVDKNSASKISATPAIVHSSSSIYDLSGKERNRTQRGINIVRNEDGSVKKQLVR